jgi:propionyl-CoA synthetase
MPWDSCGGMSWCSISSREPPAPSSLAFERTVVERLPRTRSGKILRGTMRRIADGQEYRVPSTIDDADILGEIEDAVETIGYGKK